MEDRAEYAIGSGEKGVEAVMATAMTIIKEGKQPRSALIRARLGWSPSQGTISSGLEKFYEEIGGVLSRENVVLRSSAPYFTIVANVESGLSPGQAEALAFSSEKNEIYISANVRLCARDKAVLLDSKELAQRYIDAVTPVFEKRGQNVTFSLIPVSEVGIVRNSGTQARIERESKLVRARIGQNVMAANRKPEGC